jgi:hypothetical protein
LYILRRADGRIVARGFWIKEGDSSATARLLGAAANCIGAPAATEVIHARVLHTQLVVGADVATIDAVARLRKLVIAKLPAEPWIFAGLPIPWDFVAGAGAAVERTVGTDERSVMGRRGIAGWGRVFGNETV